MTITDLEPGLRARLAEYHVSAAYDVERTIRYGDMAGSRRGRALDRLGDELLAAGVRIDRDGAFPPSTAEELAAAFVRVVVPRWRRFLREPGAQHGTREARATEQAYLAAAQRLDITADVIGALASEARR